MAVNVHFLLCLGTCSQIDGPLRSPVRKGNNIHHFVSWFRVLSSLSIDEGWNRNGRAWNMEAICNSVHIVCCFTTPPSPPPPSESSFPRDTRPVAEMGPSGDVWAMDPLELCCFHRHRDILISAVFSAETDITTCGNVRACVRARLLLSHRSQKEGS